MFDNVSQGMFYSGIMGYVIAVNLIRGIAGIFMAISVYRDAKSRGFNYKWIWVTVVLGSPILGRLVYSFYHRCVRKWIWNIPYPKVYKREGTAAMVLSIITYGIMLITATVAAVTVGVSVIKSEIDNEPIVAYYDLYGNEYEWYEEYEVPLYDREGNKYYYKTVSIGKREYVDQDGNRFDIGYCYLDKDGYFVYDKENSFTECEDDYYYSRDNEGNLCFQLDYGIVHWEKDGEVYAVSGKYRIYLFDDDSEENQNG